MENLTERSLAGAWNDEREEEFRPWLAKRLTPGRIAAANRELFRVRTEAGEVEGRVAGRLRRASLNGEAPFPAVGDWVAAATGGGAATIQAVLPRRSFFSRQSAGKSVSEQVFAANLDFLLIAMALDRDFNPNRLDRYLVMARRGKVQPAVILTKADLAADAEAHAARMRCELGEDLPVHAISTAAGSGLAALSRYLEPGVTSLLAGSSGVGKSTLINHLVGKNVAATGAVSAGNGRGRCITASARMHGTITGAFIIDNPGIRELQLWGDEENLDGAFSEIQALAESCRFRDCRHQGEPGCAVEAALSSGELTRQRYLNYVKLKHELCDTAENAAQMKRARFKQIAKARRKMRCDR